MDRKEGFYWVKYKGEWKVSEYIPELGWRSIGVSGVFEAIGETAEINENRIPSPDESNLTSACLHFINASFPDMLDSYELDIKNELEKIGIFSKYNHESI